MIYESTSDLQIQTITGIKGSLGSESVIRKLIDWRTFEIVRTGLKWSFRISNQIFLLEFKLFNWF